LVVIAPLNSAIRDEFGAALSAWHCLHYGTPVKVDWRALGGTTEIMRYLKAEYDIADSCKMDVFFGGGVYDHAIAERQNLTEPAWEEGQEPKDIINPDQLPISMGGEVWRGKNYYSAALSSFGICYNPDRLQDIGITTPPTQWSDLTDPRYRGTLGVADPTKSGSIAKAFELIVHTGCSKAVAEAGFTKDDIRRLERIIKEEGLPSEDEGKNEELTRYQAAVEKGWLDGIRTLQLIGANARYFTDSAGKVPVDVSSGDAAAGIAIDFYGKVQAESVGRGELGIRNYELGIGKKDLKVSLTEAQRHGGENEELEIPNSSTIPNSQFLIPNYSSVPSCLCEKKERLIFVAPTGGTSVNGDPISVLRGAPNKELARRFVEFVLGTEGQKLWCFRIGTPGGPTHYALRRLPARREFYEEGNPFAEYTSDDLVSDGDNAFRLAEEFEYVQRWTGAHFGVFRLLVRAMCMDAGEELRDAWRTIIAAGGPDKCPGAVSQLCQLPEGFEWSTATSFGKGDTLATSREWTMFFRDSYRKAKALTKE